MSARSISNLCVVGFVLLGLIASGIRYTTRQQTRFQQENSRWRVIYDIHFTAEETGPNDAEALVKIGIPSTTAYVNPIGEPRLVNPDPSLDDETWKGVSGTSELHLSANRPKHYQVFAEFDLELTPDHKWPELRKFESLSEVQRSRYLSSEPEFPIRSRNVSRVLQVLTVNDMSDDEKLAAFFEYCIQMHNPDDKDPEDDVELAAATSQGSASPLGRARTFVTLCRAVGIPARLVWGFQLRQAIDSPKPQVWAEIYSQNRWVPFDTTTAHSYGLPNTFLPISRGRNFLQVEGIVEKDLDQVFTYSVSRLPPDRQLLMLGNNRPSQIFDLTRLPVEKHKVISLMLLLPLGALITAVFRNVIGIRTLGVFSPALLAMSFIYAAWGTGLVILSVVLIAGVAGRNYLERLHLLIVPRQSIILTLIILSVVFIVSLVNYLDPAASTQAVLLPLVILTILIERFYVTAEEDGMSFAIQLVLGTVVVAACCYLLLRWDDIGRMLLMYPEAHFLTIAGFILIGRYTGYRITELWRFRDLAQNPKK